MVKTTEYFEREVLSRRPEIKREWCERVLAAPLARRVQANGRIRYWGTVAEFGDRVLRVITLPDGETVHNAFFDRRYPNSLASGED